MSAKVTICEHPLVQERLAILRDKRTPSDEFRSRMSEIGALLGYEALRSLRTRKASVNTPLRAAPAQVVDQPVVLAAVLRAGLGLLDGMLGLVPGASVAHIGLYRNEETLHPVHYYIRIPKGVEKAFVILCDPMLATGGSAVEALRLLKTDGAKQIAFVCLIAAKAGVKRVQEAHPDVPIFTAGIDPILNEKGYIVPGLGDAGDRTFAT